jgi:hypothetical protein
MLNSPLELLSSDQDFAKDGIDTSLATVKTCCSDNCVLVVEEESTGLVQTLYVFQWKQTYFKRLLKTCLRSANEDFAHVR